MINPFNGEGISYAIEAGELAAEAADAALRARRDAPLDGYGRALSNAWGGYFRLGSVFVDLIGHPAVMRFCTVHGMRRPTLMRFVFRLMTQLVNHRSRDITDHVVNALSRVAPAV
jgi:menaquinone-9 beta-reductase